MDGSVTLETGRYEGLQVESRVFPLCERAVESELHVLMVCNVYQDLKEPLLQQLIVPQS